MVEAGDDVIIGVWNGDEQVEVAIPDVLNVDEMIMETEQK